jgi:predicted RNase H-like HicB family nuclease
VRYAIVIEKTATGFSAFVPDLPGCVATGCDKAEVESEMKSAIRFHIDGMKQDGLVVPPPTSIAEYVEA